MTVSLGPPHWTARILGNARFWVAVLGLFALTGGCAKLPVGGAIPTTKRVTFTYTMQSAINQSFVYIIALRPSAISNPTDQGPIPVVAPPWGNGFVAGNVLYFVKWDFTQPPQSQCEIFKFADANLINYFAIGVPISFSQSPDGKTLTFQLDLAQIAPDVPTAEAYQSIQVNFLTMDQVPQGNSGSKVWDALGDERISSQINTWVTIPLRTSGNYSNASFGNIEPAGDCVDPTLDIVDWSIQVAAQ